MGGGWAEGGRRVGGGWAEVGRRLGGGCTEQPGWWCGQLPCRSRALQLCSACNRHTQHCSAAKLCSGSCAREVGEQPAQKACWALAAGRHVLVSWKLSH